MHNDLRPLPQGISDFEKLRMGNYVYVDKTEQIYNLIKRGQYYFLSRPRRFGKSLLVSTFKAIFEGRKDLFDGLWIGSSDFQWKAHPVLHLSFFEIARGGASELRQGLIEHLEQLAHLHQANLSNVSSLEQKFATLIRKMAEKNRVVVLIDEYDHAILNNISDLKAADECRKILQNFYGVLKDMDAYLRFVFLTGVSKFTQTSIFSGLNNLRDLTMKEYAATLLGYTHHELLNNFEGYIQKAATKLKQNSEQIVSTMTQWYDGYQFSDVAEIDGQSVKVFNPWSVLLFFDENKFSNYWFATGSPSFLFEVMKQQSFSPIELNNIRASSAQLGTFEIDKISLPTLLYQTGYLTIESYNPLNRMYILKMPNTEVEISFFEQLLSNITQAPAAATDNCLTFVRQGLDEGNIDFWCQALQNFFAEIPSIMHSHFENYYQSIIFAIIKTAGFDTRVEDQTNLGRIDMTIITSKLIYIIELKTRGSVQDALKQIEDTKYAQKYLMAGKKIILVGIFIDIKQRNITEWLYKKL